MSRAPDAFSSLMSEVPGVDSSLFVKRSLNDLRTKECQTTVRPKPPSVETQKEEPTAGMPRQPVEIDLAIAAADLDGLGKPTAPSTAQAVPLEDLFGHVPGCEETPKEEWNESRPVLEERREPLWIPEEEQEPEAISPIGPEMRFVGVDDAQTDSAAPVDDVEMEFRPDIRTDDDRQKDAESVDWREASEAKRSTTDFKARLDKYRSKLNKKAGDLKKRSIKVVKQGLGAAHEWVDKVVEERRQGSVSASQRKEEARQIEQFLAEMEQLSHYRREQIMSGLSQEFFQKVVEYADAHGLFIEHLFLTSETHIPSPQSPSQLESEEGACLEVTGDESEIFEEPLDEDECDLLGLSTTPDLPTTAQNDRVTNSDDLDTFFSCPATPPVTSVPVRVYEEEDLMAFEDGKSCKTDYSAMYSRLRAGGQHSEDEIRSILKETRQQEKESKMAAALQAKMEREREDEQRQELHHILKQQNREKITQWKEKHANNMRGLLTTLQSVLWNNSGWKTLSVADVLEPVQVKKAYMKANLIIHPDKVKQKGGSPEQVVLADMVFNVLKEGWQKFQC